MSVLIWSRARNIKNSSLNPLKPKQRCYTSESEKIPSLLTFDSVSCRPSIFVSGLFQPFHFFQDFGCNVNRFLWVLPELHNIIDFPLLFPHLENYKKRYDAWMFRDKCEFGFPVDYRGQNGKRPLQFFDMLIVFNEKLQGVTGCTSTPLIFWL